MADVVGEGVIDIVADTSGFDASMGTVTKKADTTGKAVSGGFAAAFGKVSGAAGAMSGVVGGAFGQIGSLANSAIKPIAEVAVGFGAIGGAVAGIAAGAVAFGAVAAAAKGLADSAVGARDRLEEIGMEVGGAAARDLDSYAAATRDLGIALDEVRVVLGSDIAGELAIVARVVASNVGPALENARAASHAFGQALNFVSLGAKPVAEILGGILYDDLTKNTRAASEAAGAMREYTTALAEASAAAAKLNNDMEKQAQADEILGRTEARRQEAEAIRLAGVAERESMEETAAIREELLGRLEDLDAQEMASSAAVRDQLLANNQTVLDARAAYHNAYLAQLQAEGVAIATRQEEERAASEAIQSYWLDLTASSVNLFGAIADSVADSYARRTSAGDQMTEKDKQQARAAFEVSQVFALGQAAIQAAIVAIGVTAQMAPYSGPFAPVIGASIGAASYAAATVAIESAPAPEFPGGRGPMTGPSPDHPMMAFLQRPEAVLTGRAVEGVGGSEAVDELNRGVRRRGSDSESIGVNVSIDPRLQRLRVTVDRKMGKRPRRGR